MNQPMPTCEAIAANPAHYIFKATLERLTQARRYQDQHLEVNRLHGHLDGLLEAKAITELQWWDAAAETRAFVWGADA